MLVTLLACCLAASASERKRRGPTDLPFDDLNTAYFVHTSGKTLPTGLLPN